MVSEVNLHLERAENEIIIAKAAFELSIKTELKEIMGIPQEKTFFNDVISHCYYSIFNAVKSYLIINNIKTKMPSEHRKVYIEFKKLIKTGKLDKELLRIYEKETMKAEVLLNILALEKSKRSRFTYNVNAEANIPHAKESIENAENFVSSIKTIIESKP